MFVDWLSTTVLKLGVVVELLFETARTNWRPDNGCLKDVILFELSGEEEEIS